MMKQWFSSKQTPPSRPPVTKEHVKKQYQRAPSFSDLLPFVDWSDETGTFLLEDGLSVGCALELRDVSTEAQPEATIEALHTKITESLSRVVPLEADNPWVVQFFVQDDLSLDPLMKRLRDYVPEAQRGDPLTQKYLSLMADHFKLLSKREGLFRDPLSGLPFRGKTRRIRMTLYRRITNTKTKLSEPPLEALSQVSANVIAQLQSIGLKVRRLKGRHFYDWWVRWFNPAPEKTGGQVDALLKQFPYPEDSNKPHGWSFTENVFFNSPTSTERDWLFDGKRHRLMLFRSLHATPEVGLIARERAMGDKKTALLDQLPDGYIYTIQVIFESQKTVEQHLTKIESSAVGKGDEPKRVKANVHRAFDEIKGTNKLFRVVQGIYYRGDGETELQIIERQVEAILSNIGLSIVHPSMELNPLDNYLRLLPFNFNPAFDQKYLFRSSYQYASDLAALLPIYGRSRGDGQHPLFVFFNRGGEGFVFDHLNPHFKMANSHMAIIGSTGAGKSVLLNMMLLSFLAVKNARVYLIECGGSFDLTTRFVSQFGRTTHTLKFDRRNPIPINPFSEAYRALETVLQEEAVIAKLRESEALVTPVAQRVERLQSAVKPESAMASDVEKMAEENRDILSEMALAIRTMVTGGLPKEEDRFRLSDDMLVMETLIAVIKDCKAKNIPHVLTSHVIEGFEKASEEASIESDKKRLMEMARAMASFAKSPMKSRFFNRPSEPLKDVDLTTVDLGFLQEKQNSAMLSLVAISLLSKILAVAEANQASHRPTILILDEAHILFKNPLVAAFVILMSKVARKIGLWLIPCTQNVEDFSTVESKKVLSMMETWLCLAVDKKEIEHMRQFKSLSDEEIALLKDIKKYPGLYSEGVLLGARYKGLFRHVPPRLALALAMTEQTEKAERKALMQENNVDELGAAELMAKRLETVKQAINEDEGFDD